MASDQERNGAPANLGIFDSLLADEDENADAPISASFISGFDDDLSGFTNHLQHESSQNSWNFTDHHLGQWSPGLDTLNSQFFSTANVSFALPNTAAIAATTTTEVQPGIGTLPSLAGFDAIDVNQELAGITAGFGLGNEFVPQALSESPVGVADERPKIPPKIGTRFSKESLRILRNWLSTHARRPFPTDEERRLLQHQTGLTKTQILNWLANARRRGKIPEYQPSSPHVRSNTTSPISIPGRAATPIPQIRASPFDPLQRWVDSPPEHEPATAAAIARAVASSPPAGMIFPSIGFGLAVFLLCMQADTA